MPVLLASLVGLALLLAAPAHAAVIDDDPFADPGALTAGQ